MKAILEHFVKGFEKALAGRKSGERRIGAELKFPLVTADGATVDRETVSALWRYLVRRGWKPDVDAVTGEVVGARKPGPLNDTVASCETGYSKTEFSLAHVGNLHHLQRSMEELREELRPFTEERGAFFLCHGIHPVTRPSKRLVMKKVRASVWDDVFPGNSYVPPEEGRNIHLFTVNAASHVHVSTSMEESVPAVNVLTGFSGAQIALTAHSRVWKGRIDPEYRCVAEKFWDWWIPEGRRVGVPERPLRDLADYCREIASFRPIFVKREGVPYLVKCYDTFADCHLARPMAVECLDGSGAELEPCEADIDTHCTCYWWNARITRYYTVENRANDEQPPDALASVAAMTLGLVSALPEASEALSARDWETLRASREGACRDALAGAVGGTKLRDLAREMLDLARLGLERRGLGEEDFLAPLERRLAEATCPADGAAEVFESGGPEALVEALRL
jgi:gamma-glutamylcysteine synthetase